jgi:glutamyl-tRNA reductase
MGELILRYFVKLGVGEIVIANRSLANAQRIAEEICPEARIVPLSEAVNIAEDADVIVSSVSSKDFILNETNAREMMKRRSGRPLFIVDIAVPRNIDPRVSDVADVFLYNIDDLKVLSEENRKNREREVEIALKMVEEDVREFLAWHEGLAAVPAINLIQNKFEEIRKRELARYRRKKLKHLSREDFKLVEELTAQIMTKTLHNPIMHLKETAKGMRGHSGRTADDAVKLIMEMFKNERQK